MGYRYVLYIFMLYGILALYIKRVLNSAFAVWRPCRGLWCVIMWLCSIVFVCWLLFSRLTWCLASKPLQLQVRMLSPHGRLLPCPDWQSEPGSVHDRWWMMMRRRRRGICQILIHPEAWLQCGGSPVSGSSTGGLWLWVQLPLQDKMHRIRQRSHLLFYTDVADDDLHTENSNIRFKLNKTLP